MESQVPSVIGDESMKTTWPFWNAKLENKIGLS
jgi:hypothetical protein